MGSTRSARRSTGSVSGAGRRVVVARRQPPVCAGFPVVLTGALLAALVSSGEAQVLDRFVGDRRACREAQEAGRIEEAFTCLDGLWTEHGAEMDVPGKIATLQQMAELYIATEELDAARTVYEYILSHLDNAWRPDDFQYQPSFWREVFVSAQKARGIAGDAPGVRNIALLDFVVTSLGKRDEAFEDLERTLPAYVTTRLQWLIESQAGAAGVESLAVVPSRDRESLLRAIAAAAGGEPDASVTADGVPQHVLVSVGRLHAVHAFVRISIILTGDDDLQLAIQMIPVENVRVRCPVTRSGKADDLFLVLADGLEEFMRCAFDFAHASRIEEYLGPVREGARALHHLHQALVCQEQDDLDCAIREAREAASLIPDDPAVGAVVGGLELQRARLETAPGVRLPAPGALEAEISGERHASAGDERAEEAAGDEGAPGTR